jgi:hypothetical protein
MVIRLNSGTVPTKERRQGKSCCCAVFLNNCNVFQQNAGLQMFEVLTE